MPVVGLAERRFHQGVYRDERRDVTVEVSAVVANHSSLPNALLGARVWLKGRDGAFLELLGTSLDERTPLPLNVPPLQTVLLRLRGRLSFPASAELEKGGIAAYTEHHLSSPREIKLELLSLNERKDELLLRDAA